MWRSTLLVSFLFTLTSAAPTTTPVDKRADAFDYIIIGGGTAGLAMAERLSEEPSTTVAVIEAGTFYQVEEPLLASTPAGDVVFVGSSTLDQDPLVDWSFVTEPQAGANGRQIHYARGKCLGGSSALNFMIYQRGSAGSYQAWADAVGDDSYTFDNLLPYFKKSVQFTPPSDSRAPNASAEYNAAAFDPSGGPLDVSYANYAGPFSSWIEQGLGAIGIQDAEDFNSGSLLGKQYCSSTINPSNEHRESSQTSFVEFLNTTGPRANMQVYSLTMANKILFDDNKQATGVDTSAGTITANKEVILSAGAFQSPQLLMLSGIGPAATLSQFNIPVIADRPGVGQNMTDHIFMGPAYRVNVQTFTRLANDLLYTTAQFATDYTFLKQGPLTNPVCDYLGWEKAPRDMISSEAAAALSQFPADWPEIEYLSAPGYVGDFSSLFTSQPKDGYQYATILEALVAPLSRGNVTLASADASDLPLINPNWLTDPTDQSVAVAGYKRVRQAFASSAMAPVLADPTEYYPGPAVQSDDQILDAIRDSLMTVWHASCTCRMGKADDPNAVVDSNANVIGVKGLRVVDASSFALLPPGHPQSTVYMLAEKIAAQIMAGGSGSAEGLIEKDG